MTKTFQFIALALVAGVINLSSCTQTEIEGTSGTIVTPLVKTSITAITPGTPQTRVSFDDQFLVDNDSKDVILAWEANDMLVAYKGEEKAAVFYYTGQPGASSGTFVAETETELEGDYTLIYTTLSVQDHKSQLSDMRNAIQETPVTQLGSASTTHLKNNVWMEAEYTVGHSAVFSHKKVLMTLNISTPTIDNLLDKAGKPIMLVIEEKDINEDITVYSVNLYDMDWTSGFRVNLFINPGSGNRNLSFTIHTDNSINLSGNIRTEVPYIAGNRYTGNLGGGFLNLWGYLNPLQIKDFCACDLNGNIWTFKTNNSDNSSDADWERLRESIQWWPSPVTLIFPDLEILPAGAFDGCSNLVAIHAPLMEDYIKANTFRNCSNLQIVTLPAAKDVQANSFEGCSSLISIKLPLVTEIQNEAFSGCTKLSEMVFPLAVNLGDKIFQDCFSLSSLYLGTQTWSIYDTSDKNLFYDSTNSGIMDLSNVDFYISYNESTNTANGGTDLNNKTWRGYGPFNSINVVE